MSGKPTYEELEKRAEELERTVHGYRQTETKMIEAIQEWETIFNATNAVIWLLDQNFRVLRTNRKAEQLFQLSKKEIIGKHCWEIVHGTKEPIPLCPVFRARDSMLRESTELQIDDKWFEVTVDPIPDANGKYAKAVHIISDITQRKLIEESLERNETILNSTQEISKIGGWQWDIKSQKMYWTEELYRLHGFEPGQFEPGSPKHVEFSLGCYNQDDSLVILEAFQKCVEEGIAYDFELPFTKLTGERIWIRTSAKPIYSDGRVEKVIGNFIDITDRKKAENALYESEKKFRDLFDMSPLPVALSEAETGRLIDVNAKFCELSKFEKEELLGRTATELGFYSEYERERFLAEIKASGETKGLEFDIKIKDGSIHSALFFARPIQIENKNCIINTVYDLTKRKRAEAQLRKFKQLEILTNLSGGIAHEFNNALAVISGNIDLLQTHLPNHKYIQHFERQAMQSIKRMTNLTTQLLAYARSGKYRAEQIDLNNFIKTSLPIILPNIHSGIIIDTDLKKNILKITADTTQLQMVLSAVLTNASEAMGDKGHIRIKTGEETIDESYTATYPGLMPGRYVFLTIEDNGEGMDEEIKNRIFEPFFTTKFQGRGLGMAAVYGIVKNHDGHIYVDSEPGKGTMVCIYFPWKQKIED